MEENSFAKIEEGAETDMTSLGTVADTILIP